MVHFADYLPHNRKAASRIPQFKAPGTSKASALTARVARLKSAGRLIQCISKDGFYYEIKEHCDKVSVAQIMVLSKMANVINGWFFGGKGRTLFIIFSKDKTCIKELVLADMEQFETPTSSIGFEWVLEKRLIWSDSKTNFVDISPP